jgi:hypothetical protein
MFLTGESPLKVTQNILTNCFQNFNPSEVLIQKNTIIFGNFWDDFHSFIWRIDLQRRLCFWNAHKTFSNRFVKKVLELKN